MHITSTGPQRLEPGGLLSQSFSCNKRVFDLVKDFGTSESPKSTRSSTTHWCPGRPGHPAFRHNIASSLRLHTGLPYDWTPRSDAPLGSPLAPSARRVSRVASRLPGTTRLRFALHGGQRMTGPGSLPAFRVEYPPHGTAQSLSSALQRVKSAPGQNHFSSGRAFTRCTGLLLGWCMMRLNFFTCSVETVSGCFITYQRTPSVQGGVVSDPLKR